MSSTQLDFTLLYSLLFILFDVLCSNILLNLGFSLQISGLKEEDLGDYQCVASNAHGKHQTTVELDKTRIPIPEAAYGGSEHAKNSLLSLAACLVTFIVSILIH